MFSVPKSLPITGMSMLSNDAIVAIVSASLQAASRLPNGDVDALIRRADKIATNAVNTALNLIKESDRIRSNES